MVNRIVLFRHLPTVSDDDPRRGTLLSGPELDGEPLSPRAEAISRWMRGRLGGRAFTTIRRDESVRCVLSAIHLADATACDDIRAAEKALRPRRWGALAGHRWSDVEPILAAKTPTARRKYRPDGGESWMDVEARLRPPLFNFIGHGQGNIAIVSHQSVLRVALGILVGFKEAIGTAVSPGGFVELEHADTEAGWSIARVENPPTALVA
jgi:broad specificity phosphatase PhoE